jgi:hypothetical protein
MRKLSTAPPKTIVKRQQCACDSCRKSKKRCDGCSPCIRCLRRKLPCVYSSNNRLIVPAHEIEETKAKPQTQFVSVAPQIQPQVDTLVPEKTIANAFMKKHLINLYFASTNLQFFLDPNDSVVLETSTKPSIQVQLYSVLAITARTFGDYTLATRFENHAKGIARDIFDEFSVEAALGFGLLTNCLWASDRTSSAHYRDITASIVKRIRTNTRQEVKKSVLERLLRVQAASGFPDHDRSESQQEIQNLAVKVRNFLSTVDEDYQEPRSMVPWHQFLSILDFSSKFFESVLDHSDPHIYEHRNLFRVVDAHKCNELFFHLREWCQLLSLIFQHRPFFRLIFAVEILSYEAVLYFVSGDRARAVGNIQMMVQDLKQNTNYVRYLCPFSLWGLHFPFMVCIYCRELSLARDILNFIQLLTEHLPIAKSVLKSHESILQSAESESTNVPLATSQWLAENIPSMGNYAYNSGFYTPIVNSNAYQAPPSSTPINPQIFRNSPSAEFRDYNSFESLLEQINIPELRSPPETIEEFLAPSPLTDGFKPSVFESYTSTFLEAKLQHLL